MKKFTKINKIFEDIEKDNQELKSDDVKANLPENIESQSEESTESENNSESTVVKLFSKLFESREIAHIYHLQVRGDEGSHAAHLALGYYYEQVLNLIDELVEVYQGQYGIVEGYDVIDTKVTSNKDKVEYFTELLDSIKNERKLIVADDTHLHNIVDEIVALGYKTLYRLKFNK
jgi:hypothetical protein